MKMKSKTFPIAMFGLGSLISAGNVFAGTLTMKDYSAHTDWVNNKGQLIIVQLKYDQYSQPTDYTCGPTNIAAYVDYEMKKFGIPLDYTKGIMDMYNYTDTNRDKSVTPDELKLYLSNLIATNNYYYKDKLKGKKIPQNLYEVKYEKTDDALNDIHNKFFTRKASTFLYGNTYRASQANLAGSHYYTLRGSVQCNIQDCGYNFKGIYIHDSVYQSKSFPDRTKYPDVIPPYTAVSGNDLANYFWLKTGAPFYQPWNRRHISLITAN